MRALTLILLSSGCYKRDPGPALLDHAEGPVRTVAQSGSAPATDLVVMVRAGSAYDPPGQEGLAWLTARLLREGGAGDRTPEQVEALLYRLGTDIEVVVDHELITLRTRALHDDLDELAPLLADLVIDPRWSPEALDRLRGEGIDHLSTGLLSSDEQLGQQVFENWLWEGHPYGHPVEGRVGSLPVLDRQDLVAFHDERWVRPAVALGVSGPMVGDDGAIDPTAPGAAAITALQERLSTLPPRLWRDVTPRGVAKVEGRHLLVVESGTDSVGVHFGHPIPVDRGDDDWPALLLATTALGEHRQSHGRLYRSLRGDRGLNYGDYAYLERYVQDGWSARQMPGTGRVQNAFHTWVRPVAADNGAFALRAAVSLVEEWAESGPTDDEVALMKAYLPDRIALWGEEPIRRLAWSVEAALMGWPDPLVALPERIAELTPAEVRGAVQRHVRPDDLRIVVVAGDGEAFVASLDAPSPLSYAGDPPAPGTEQATQDAAWAEADLRLDSARVVPTDALFQ